MTRETYNKFHFEKEYVGKHAAQQYKVWRVLSAVGPVARPCGFESHLADCLYGRAGSSPAIRTSSLTGALTYEHLSSCLS